MTWGPTDKESKSLLYRSLATEDSFTVYGGEQFTPYQENDLFFRSLSPPQVEVVRRVESQTTRKLTTRPMHGYTSDPIADRHREHLLQEGLDFYECVNWGWFNDNHIQNTHAVLGYPLFVELHKIKDKGLSWYVKGCLLVGDNLYDIDKVWNIAMALRKLDRRLSFSVEGKIVERKGPVIKKSIIRNIAITPYPVNIRCTWDIFLDAMEGTEEYVRALSADSSLISIGGGGVLVARQLEGTPKRPLYRCPSTGKEFSTEGELREYQSTLSLTDGIVEVGSVLDKAQAVVWIMEQDPRYTSRLAEDLFDMVTSEKWNTYLNTR